MFKRLTLAASAAAIAFTPAFAEELTADAVQKLADFGKLEANIAELTLAATTYVSVNDEGIRADIAAELNEDIEQVGGYVSRLREGQLSADEAAALNSFEESFGGLAATAQEMLKPDFKSTPAAIAAIWKQATETDETIDDVLDELLEAMGVKEIDAS